LFFSGARANRKWCELQPGRKRQQRLCSGRTAGLKLSFSAPFLWFFLWTNKERTDKSKEESLSMVLSFALIGTGHRAQGKVEKVQSEK
jgi:hypothetical protein